MVDGNPKETHEDTPAVSPTINQQEHTMSNTKKVTREDLYELQRLATDRFLKILQNADIKPIRATMMAEIRKFLQDNDIKVSRGEECQSLQEASVLPFKQVDTG